MPQKRYKSPAAKECELLEGLMLMPAHTRSHYWVRESFSVESESAIYRSLCGLKGYSSKISKPLTGKNNSECIRCKKIMPRG